MIGLAILCAVIVVVYVLNTILPVDWVWLSTEQMADIRSLANDKTLRIERELHAFNLTNSI